MQVQNREPLPLKVHCVTEPTEGVREEEDTWTSESGRADGAGDSLMLKSFHYFEILQKFAAANICHAIRRM